MLGNILRLLPAALLLLAVAGAAVTGPKPAAAETLAPAKLDPPDHVVLKQIRRYQRETWRWQRLMGVRRTPTHHAAKADPSRAFKLWVRNLWHKRAARAWRAAQSPPHKTGWMCIHRYEGAWNDPDPPYYGGLQMDLSFQRAYGGHLLRSKGTADKWTPLEQMWVAEKAHRSGRGFYPWPNTARSCGLI